MDTDDVTLEAEDGEGSTGTAEQKLKSLRDKLKSVETEAGENLAGWQRSKADYINLGKRMREMEDSLARASAVTILGELVEVFDSIEASGHAVILKQLDSSLLKLGVTRICPLHGTVFNPEEQEVVQGVATEDKTQDNTICNTLQSGYKIGDSIIRPARVTVYHHG